jgi:hypothetical protein
MALKPPPPYLLRSARRQLRGDNWLISIQPLGRFWQEPEPSQATGMALARCILGKFLGVVCRCFLLTLDVPTFAVSTSPTVRALLVAKGGTVDENGVRQFCRNDAFSTPFRDLLHAANLRHGTDGFTSLLEGRRSEDNVCLFLTIVNFENISTLLLHSRAATSPYYGEQ